MDNTEQKLLPVVAIVGRPNVGKSTLFNRLIGKRQAIENQEAGTTRDRLYGEVNWCGQKFSLIDTAGLIKNIDNEIKEAAMASVEIAIEEAELIIFLCDISDGGLHVEREIAKKLRRAKKKVILAGNKCDKKYELTDLIDYKRLGFDNPIAVSAIQGKNSGILLDVVCKNIEKIEDNRIVDDSCIKISIIGRPNAGKSTLLNSIIGSNKMIVSTVPGTTRDSADFKFKFKGQDIRIIDTAGLKRRSKVKYDTPESFAFLRAMSSLKDSKIAIYMIDATEKIAALDLKLLGDAAFMGKSIILAINKIDLAVEDKSTFMAKILGQLQKELNFIPWVPVVFISAKEKTHITELMNQVLEIQKERNEEIGVEDLQAVFNDARTTYPQIDYFKTLRFEKANPPIFKLKTRRNKKPHFSHMRFLENKIRNNFEYRGTPIFIDWVKPSK